MDEEHDYEKKATTMIRFAAYRGQREIFFCTSQPVSLGVISLPPGTNGSVLTRVRLFVRDVLLPPKDTMTVSVETTRGFQDVQQVCHILH